MSYFFTSVRIRKLYLYETIKNFPHAFEGYLEIDTYVRIFLSVNECTYMKLLLPNKFRNIWSITTD